MGLTSNVSTKQSSNVDAVLVASDDDHLHTYGYQFDRLKHLTTWLAIVLTLGVLRLVFFWKPHWMLYCTHRPCSLHDAHTVLLIDQYDQYFVEKVQMHHDVKENLLYPTLNGEYKQVNKVRYIDNRKTRYIWNYDEKKFDKLVGLDFNFIECDHICIHYGLAEKEQSKRRLLFGRNLIEIQIEPIAKIFFTEVLNPFYIYQFFAIGFWAADAYYYYASYILFMSIVSLTLTTYQIRVNQRRLRDKVFGSTEVLVCRAEGRVDKIDSSQLVPGDKILLDRVSGQLYCDAALVSGEVIVNESMLTGESSPVTKTPLRPTKHHYDHKRQSKHILFAGTSVLQVRQLGSIAPTAVVIRTNFETAKGELVKSILFPKPIDFKFSRHINHFLMAMALIAAVGFIYTVIMKVLRHSSFTEILFKAVDLITIVVPPELPAALTIATIFVDKRLRNKQIFCMSPRAINISGCVDCVCFDKTGTLTEESIELHEIVRVERHKSDHCCIFGTAITQTNSLSDSDSFLHCLATCHSLKLLDGDFIGDDLEIKLFNWTKWHLEEPINAEEMYGYTVPTVVSSPQSLLKLGVLKQFPFTSKSARMSVVVSTLQTGVNHHMQFYIKGAPEMIVKMCRQETVPTDFDFVLSQYTKKSYRVLAIAFKSLPKLTSEQLDNNPDEEYEHNLTFLGLVVMRNPLKTSTLKTIQVLNEANIRSIMVTGDNLLTALSVARECSIIQEQKIIIVETNETIVNEENKPELKWHMYEPDPVRSGDNRTGDCTVVLQPNERYNVAVTGETLRAIVESYPSLVRPLVARCVVYGRMAPDQKQQLVEWLQSVGHYVAMCGDGANDCGALKVAHAGISLSDTEASVAAAFTSLTGQVWCVVDLLREGRASLVSVFGIVRYMACYNITTFLTICILYFFHSALTDVQNLYQDIAIISLYIFLFGRTFPYEKLSPIRPPTSLIGMSQFSSIVLQLSLVTITQFIIVFYLHSQSWFVPNNVEAEETENEDYKCHDNYALFIIQVLQYVTLVIIFSKGAPYRKPIYTNKLLSLAILVTSAVTLFIVLTPEVPFPWISKVFGLEYEGFPFHFRLQIVGLNIVHLIVAILTEKFIVEQFISNLTRKYKKQPIYETYKETYSLDWLTTR